MSRFKKILFFSIDNLSSISFGLLSTVFIARLYGPENMGYLSYIQALVSMFSFMFILGMDNILMREFSKKNDLLSTYLSIFILRFFGLILAVLTICFFVSKSQTPDNLVLPLVFSCVIASFFGKSASFRLYFQANEKPKVISLSTLASRFLALLFIIYCIESDRSFLFACQYLALYSLVSQLILLFSFLVSVDNLNLKGISLQKILNKTRYILNESRFLIISSALLPLFMYVDMVIIEYFLSAEEVGIYSVAFKLVNQIIFFGHILVFSFFNSIRVEVEHDNLRGNYIIAITQILLCIGIVGAAITSCISPYIIKVLYGDAYAQAAPLLQILIWKIPFIFLGALYSRILVIKGWQHIELYKTILTVVFSLSCSMILVQIFGLIIIPVVSVFSFFIADFFSYLLFKETRVFSKNIIESLSVVFTRPSVFINNCRRILYD